MDINWLPIVQLALVAAACIVSAIIGAFAMAWFHWHYRLTYYTPEERKLLELRPDLRRDG